MENLNPNKNEDIHEYKLDIRFVDYFNNYIYSKILTVNVQSQSTIKNVNLYYYIILQSILLLNAIGIQIGDLQLLVKYNDDQFDLLRPEHILESAVWSSSLFIYIGNYKNGHFKKKKSIFLHSDIFRSSVNTIGRVYLKRLERTRYRHAVSVISYYYLKYGGYNIRRNAISYIEQCKTVASHYIDISRISRGYSLPLRLQIANLFINKVLPSNNILLFLKSVSYHYVYLTIYSSFSNIQIGSPPLPFEIFQLFKCTSLITSKIQKLFIKGMSIDNLSRQIEGKIVNFLESNNMSFDKQRDYLISDVARVCFSALHSFFWRLCNLSHVTHNIRPYQCLSKWLSKEVISIESLPRCVIIDPIHDPLFVVDPEYTIGFYISKFKYYPSVVNFPFDLEVNASSRFKDLFYQLGNSYIQFKKANDHFIKQMPPFLFNLCLVINAHIPSAIVDFQKSGDYYTVVTLDSHCTFLFDVLLLPPRISQNSGFFIHSYSRKKKYCASLYFKNVENFNKWITKQLEPLKTKKKKSPSVFTSLCIYPESVQKWKHFYVKVLAHHTSRKYYPVKNQQQSTLSVETTINAKRWPIQLRYKILKSLHNICIDIACPCYSYFKLSICLLHKSKTHISKHVHIQTIPQQYIAELSKLNAATIYSLKKFLPVQTMEKLGRAKLHNKKAEIIKSSLCDIRDTIITPQSFELGIVPSGIGTTDKNNTLVSYFNGSNYKAEGSGRKDDLITNTTTTTLSLLPKNIDFGISAACWSLPASITNITSSVTSVFGSVNYTLPKYLDIPMYKMTGDGNFAVDYIKHIPTASAPTSTFYTYSDSLHINTLQQLSISSAICTIISGLVSMIRWLQKEKTKEEALIEFCKNSCTSILTCSVYSTLSYMSLSNIITSNSLSRLVVYSSFPVFLWTSTICTICSNSIYAYYYNQPFSWVISSGFVSSCTSLVGTAAFYSCSGSFTPIMAILSVVGGNALGCYLVELLSRIKTQCEMHLVKTVCIKLLHIDQNSKEYKSNNISYINSRFKRLARFVHPDRNTSKVAKEQFDLLMLAKNILLSEADHSLLPPMLKNLVG